MRWEGRLWRERRRRETRRLLSGRGEEEGGEGSKYLNMGRGMREWGGGEYRQGCGEGKALGAAFVTRHDV